MSKKVSWKSVCSGLLSIFKSSYFKLTIENEQFSCIEYIH